MVNGYGNPYEQTTKKKINPYGGLPPGMDNVPAYDMGGYPVNGAIGSIAQPGGAYPQVGQQPGGPMYTGGGANFYTQGPEGQTVTPTEIRNPFTGEVITPGTPVVSPGTPFGGYGGGTGGMTAQEQATLTGATGENTLLRQQLEALKTAGVPAGDYADYYTRLAGAGAGMPYQAPPSGIPEGMFQAPTAVGFGGQVAYQPTQYLAPGETAPQFQPIEYQTAYSPEMWEQQRALTQAGIQAGFEPTREEMEKTLAGIRERAIRQQGVSSGLVTEAQRPVQEAYAKEMARQMGTGMREFEQQRLAAQMAEQQARAGFGMEEARTGRGFGLEQQLEAQQFGRGERQAAKQMAMEQGMSEQAWNRQEQSRIQQTQLQQAVQRGEITMEQAQQQWQAQANERLRQIDIERQNILLELQIAQDQNNFERQRALQIELANISAEAQREMAAGEAEAGMWSGIGTLAGAVVGGPIGAAIGTKLFGK